ncbi:MAG: 30S ribosomal protein S18 [Nitrospiria bacterium]
MEKKYFHRRHVCRFCNEKKTEISFKETQLLKGFLTDRGKIIPRRISGNCSSHQKHLTRAIKRARNIAFLAFVEKR